MRLPDPRHAVAVFAKQNSAMKQKNILLAALVALAPVPAMASEPVAESLSYRAFIGGFPLGTLNLKIAMEDTRYATEAQFLIGRWLRWALDTDARASSEGSITDGRMIPTKFDYWVRDEEKERRAQIEFDADGNPVAVRSDPPFDAKTYDVTLDDVRGAVDPATGVALLSAPRAEPCAVDMTIFDGRKYHRISLKADGGTVEKPVCTGLYERLGGFKAKYMTPERRSYAIRAELVQIAPDRWRPRRVSAETKFGAGVVVLQ